MHCSLFPIREDQDQCASRFVVWSGPTSWFILCPPPTQCPPTTRRRELSEVYLIKALILCMRAPSHDLRVSQRPHLQIYQIGDQVSAYEFGGGTNIQSIALTIYICNCVLPNPFPYQTHYYYFFF